MSDQPAKNAKNFKRRSAPKVTDEAVVEVLEEEVAAPVVEDKPLKEALEEVTQEDLEGFVDVITQATKDIEPATEAEEVVAMLEPVVETPVEVPVAPVVPTTPIRRNTPTANPRTTKVSEAPVKEVVEKKSLATRVQEQYGITRGKVNWSPEVGEQFLKDGILPAKTNRGNWVSDVTRVDRVSQLDQSELLDFVEGSIQAPTELDDELYWKEVYHRFQLPGNLPKDKVKEVIVDKVDPVKTKDGVLVECASRPGLPLEKWTYLETRAALLKEIDDCGHSERDLIDRLKETLQLPKETVDELVLLDLKEAKKSTMYNQLIEAKLEEYRSARTGPSRKGAKAIGDANVMLLKQIRQLITKEYPVFKEGWNVLLGFVKREENTLFSDRVRYEHWDQVPLSGKDLEALEALLTLLAVSVENSNKGRAIPVQQVVELTKHLGRPTDVEKIVAYYS